MNALLTFILRHPLPCLLACILLGVGFYPGISRLTIDTSAESLLNPDSPRVQFYEKTRATFGDDVIETIVYHGNDVFDAEVLGSIERVTEAARALPEVSRIISLTTVSNLKGRDGELDTQLLIPAIPSEPEEITRIREDALTNPILIGEVVNETGTAAAIHLFIDTGPQKEEKEGQQLVEEIENILEQERELLGDRVEIFQVGSPYLKTEITRSLTKDRKHLGRITLLVLLSCLVVFFRSVLAAAIPIMTAYLSIWATAGMMGYIGIQVNPITAIIPTLILVIGSTEDIHMLSEYADRIALGDDRRTAIRRMAQKCGLAIFLTSLTTLAGFVTLSFNSTPIIRDFGIAASFGIIVNFIITVLLVPSVLRYFPIPSNFRQASSGGLQSLRSFIVGATENHQRAIVLGLGLMAGVALWGCSQVQVNTSYINFFREDSEVNRRYTKMADLLTGGTNYYVVIDTGKENGLHSPQVMQEVDALARYLRTKSDKVIGYADFLRKLNVEMFDGDPSRDRVPDSRQTIAQYTLLMGSDDLDRFVDFDLSTTALLVKGGTSGSREISGLLQAVEEFRQGEMDASLKVNVTGETILVSEASDRMSREIVQNLALMGLVIFGVISFFLRSSRAGAIAMLPNLFPVLFVFGFMGIAGIPLSTATFPVTIIALGIAVDDTIHMLVRYGINRRRHPDLQRAVRDTLHYEIRPVFTTSIALAAGFMVLSSGEFASIQQFGILSSLAMIGALISDLFLTPLLLKWIPEIRIPGIDPPTNSEYQSDLS